MTEDIGAAKARLARIEGELARMPAWAAGSPRATALTREAARLRDLIERTCTYRKWTVPEGTGPLARFKISIPRSPAC